MLWSPELQVLTAGRSLAYFMSLWQVLPSFWGTAGHGNREKKERTRAGSSTRGWHSRHGSVVLGPVECRCLESAPSPLSPRLLVRIPFLLLIRQRDKGSFL